MGALWWVKNVCFGIGSDHCLCHPKIVEQKARDSGGITVELTSSRWNRGFMTVVESRMVWQNSRDNECIMVGLTSLIRSRD